MMKTNSTEALRLSILVLEQKQSVEAKFLQEQLSITYENLKPINFLRNAINEITRPASLKGNLTQFALGLFTSYLSRKILVRSSSNPLIRIAGIFAQHSLTRLIANNSTTIKIVINHFFNLLGGKYRIQKD